MLRTNVLVCVVIILGFVATSVISYRSNQGIFRKDVESVTVLTSEGIYHQIDSIFSKPVNISLTMANDSLLKEFLEGEQEHPDDEAYIEIMRDYLDAYHEKYGYDSVFLASAKTKRYYHFNGLDRILEPGDPENVWFYSLLGEDEECTVVIDNDEVQGAGNEITVFINCQIRNEEGEPMGIVGVGFRVGQLQSLFRDYERQYGVSVCLVSPDGTVEISTEQTGFVKVNLFDICAYPQLRAEVLTKEEQAQTFWHSSEKGSGFLVSRYIENLDWSLIVENDTTLMNQTLANQFIREMLIIVVIIVLVLLIITGVMRNYNAKIIELTVAVEQQHRDAFQKATEQLYENIYEFDVTHNRAASEATVAYFESLGAPKGTPFDECLQIVAEKQIKEEYRKGYIDTFSTEHVLAAFEQGIENLRYDFMITADGTSYYWMRITAQIFYWKEDGSVRMLTYRQNIDEEKRREQYLFDQMQKDSLTGILNKAATQERIQAMLARSPEGSFAFLIIDVDHFKQVNDRMGHAAGDTVLIEFARMVKGEFQEDVVGRIGGDEFVVFLPVADWEMAQNRAGELSAALRRQIDTEAGPCAVTASIGVAVAPQAGRDFETLYKNADLALYQTKRNGKDGYTLYCGE